MTEIPPSTATGMTTDWLQQEWFYAPWYQQEHTRTDLLCFHWYIGLHIKTPQFTATPPSYSTNHLIQHSATLLYFIVRVAPATAITMTAYLPALATIN